MSQVEVDHDTSQISPLYPELFDVGQSTMTFPADTILLLHPPQCDPYPFLSRLLEQPVDEDELVVPWTIDNKYYTAQVNIQILELEDGGVIPPGVEVTTIPYALTQSMASEPKDIALAVRVGGHTDRDGADDLEDPRIGREDWEEMFEELGMEVVDELAQPEEDDERPISPAETVRQTLMTHLWAGMKRKPLDNGRAANPLPAHRDIDADVIDSAEEDDADEAGPSTFPISFHAAQLGTEVGDEGKERREVDPGAAFPGLAELRQQIEMDEFDRFERTGDIGGRGLGRLDMLDELLGATPGEEEYARLDEWLDDGDDDVDDDDADGDGDEFGGGIGGGHAAFVPLEADADGEANEHGLNGARDEPAVTANTNANDTFDDDFDDFAAFQSAPRAGEGQPSRQGRDQASTMGPTPLLYHLQSVRTELAGLDEEERRVRAAKEVARVMRDLGFDDADGDLFEDEDGAEFRA